MLQASHHAALKSDTGVELWRFEQRVEEAVMVPAGCPHQVRALGWCLGGGVGCEGRFFVHCGWVGGLGVRQQRAIRPNSSNRNQPANQNRKPSNTHMQKQVRNLRPCIKAAVDFVSPESISQILHRAWRLRALGLAARDAAAAPAKGSSRSGAGGFNAAAKTAAPATPATPPPTAVEATAVGSEPPGVATAAALNGSSGADDPAELPHADKLQARKILVWGAVRSWRALQLLLRTAAATAGEGNDDDDDDEEEEEEEDDDDDDEEEEEEDKEEEEEGFRQAKRRR